MTEPICQDELQPIADYIAREMNTNAHGPVVRKLRQLNAASAKACIQEFIDEPSVWRRMFALTPQECARFEITSRQAALLLWASKVMVNADWDHKPARFKSRATGSGTWHVRDDYKYFYDIWSNIHYGYAGRAAGFSESLLLDGAGLEQLATDLIVRISPPTRSTNVAGLRAYDDPSDREAIRIGVVLYRANSAAVTSAQILKEVLNNGQLTRERV